MSQKPETPEHKETTEPSQSIQLPADYVASYAEINKEAWNSKTAFHVQSEFYDLAGFLKGNTSLKEIELGLLGDIKGKTILHLQCHFGQDSLSLARMGAKVTGVDLSDRAIDKARELNELLGLDAQFVCCNLYDLPEHLPPGHFDTLFDIVYTTYGTIGWLPDINGWASLIARYLKPGGRLVFVEFHPVIWMFDNEFGHVQYSYFNSDPIVENETGTYADKAAPIQGQTVGWNHGLGEVVTALQQNGLQLTTLQEFSYSPYDCFHDMVETEPGHHHIRAFGDKIPMVYAIVAEKPA